MDKVQFEPLEDRILVVPIKTDSDGKTDSGLYIPDSAKRATCKVKVIATGTGLFARDNGKPIPSFINKGDTALIPADNNKPVGIEIEVDTENGKETAYVLRESDVLLVITKKQINETR